VKIEKGAWLGLLTFCGLMTLAASLGFAALFTGGAAAFAASGIEPVQKADAPSEQAFSGMITDSQCGARHDRWSGKRPAECARMCVRNGSKYMLVNGDQKNILEGSETTLDRLAGRYFEREYHQGDFRRCGEIGNGGLTRLASPPSAPAPSLLLAQ
jgi:hypothetical protein